MPILLVQPISQTHPKSSWCINSLNQPQYSQPRPGLFTMLYLRLLTWIAVKSSLSLIHVVCSRYCKITLQYLQCNYLITRIRAKIEKVTSTLPEFNLRFLWIPSHRGIAGNERADALTKRVIIEGSSPRNFKIPHSDIHPELHIEIDSRFEQYLEQSIQAGKGVLYFQKVWYKMRKPWFAEYKTSRSHITSMIRLRSNHYNLNASLFRKNLVNDPSCSCGSPYQNFNHVLFDCSLAINKGLALRKLVYKILGSNACDITNALAKPTQKFCRVLAAYCKARDFNI